MRGLPLAYAWRNVLARGPSTLVTLLGVGVSVMVFVVIQATADGIGRAATSTGDPRNLVVLSKGSSSAERSRLGRDQVSVVRFSPGVARDVNGDPMASEELLMVRTVAPKGVSENDPAASRFTPIRGVTSQAFQVHSRVRVARGRLPRRSGEILVGRLLVPKLGGLEIGDSLRYAGREHEIVGILSADGQLFEGEVWVPLDDLRAEVAQREASIVVLRLAEPRAREAVLGGLGVSKRVTVDVKSEPAYYEEVQRASVAFVFMGNLIGLIMGLGAIAAGMNTMYAAMSRRVREMGTLRALGFGRYAVGGGLLLESVLIAGVGGLVGGGLALAFDGIAMDLVGLAFEIDVQAGALLRGAGLALAVGLFGGLLPARAAVRLEIVDALRQA